MSDDDAGLSPDVALCVAEYNAARADCLQGLTGQQSILTWSIAALGVLFAAGLSVSPHVGSANTIRHWVFFLGIPLLTLGASIAWLGEIFRMERDAHYMRLIERSTWPLKRQREFDKAKRVRDGDVRYPRLLLNTWVAHSEPERRNRVHGYFGGVLIYIGATACSLALACSLLHENRPLAFALSGAWLVIYVAVTGAQLQHIRNFSKQAAVKPADGDATRNEESQAPSQ
ncbi:MAG TPA: hypothetical protein VMI13_12425 [Solirubrobacteraceae bacterium]|nr:hypothetical protein [Solirubrobacteraceae bacterium]